MKQTGHITCLFCTSICWCVKFNGIGKLIGFNWTGLATLHHWGCVCVIVQSHSRDTEKKLRKMGVILSNNTNVHRAHIWGKFMSKLAFIFSHTNIIFTITKPYKLSYIYHWLLGFPKIFIWECPSKRKPFEDKNIGIFVLEESGIRLLSFLRLKIFHWQSFLSEFVLVTTQKQWKWEWNPRYRTSVYLDSVVFALQSIHCRSGKNNTDGDVRGVGGGGGGWDQEGDGGGGGDPTGGTSSHLCHRKCDDLSGITVSPLLTLLFVCKDFYCLSCHICWTL